MSKGSVLIEASFTYVLLSFALVALMSVFLVTIRANKDTERVAAGTQLSVQLLEEVRLRRWDETTPTPRAPATPSAIGADDGEAAADKAGFDDIDDFDGYSESPPADPLGQPIAEMAGYTRDVAVAYVDSSLQPDAGVTDYKRVTVCSRWPKMRPVCLDTVLTNR
ncbi:MAG: hypothetical protein ABII00_06575 [Elusimicrobiota bacterium]